MAQRQLGQAIAHPCSHSQSRLASLSLGLDGWHRLPATLTHASFTSTSPPSCSSSCCSELDRIGISDWQKKKETYPMTGHVDGLERHAWLVGVADPEGWKSNRIDNGPTLEGDGQRLSAATAIGSYPGPDLVTWPGPTQTTTTTAGTAAGQDRTGQHGRSDT